jgi:surface carbohydrate biosynthesis protein (TIGR04326 family)
MTVEKTNKNKLSKIISLLDTDNIPRGLTDSVVYKWNGYQENSDCYSVPVYLEVNSDRFKNKYLTFINNLGDTIINKKTINDHLTLKNGYNLWWMSLIAEKNPFKSSGIFDCLRLFALEEIIIIQNSKKLILHSSSEILAEAVKILCLNLNVEFYWYRVKSKKRVKKVKNLLDIYRLLPSQIRNFISFIRQLCRLFLLKKKNCLWFSGENSLTIVSFFGNLEKNALDKGNFRSIYWGSLNNIIRDIGKDVNWLQIFSSSPVIPSVHSGLLAIKKFNENKSNNGFHAFLEGYLSFTCILRACLNYIRFFFSSWHWKKKYISAAFQPKNSSVWLWPLLKNEWQTSTRGLTVFQNFLWIELFDAAMANIPKQKAGLYLQENLNWERALVHAWKYHGHGQLTGVVHTPIRYWDLRYFDNLSGSETASNSILSKLHLRPDFIAVNGPFSLKSYLDDGYPSDELVSVEALRYENFFELTFEEKILESKKKNYKSINNGFNVLILGQILWSQTHGLLTCLEQATANMSLRCNFTLKTHQNCPMSIKNYPILNLKETNDSLEKILPHFDLVFVAGSSTAALDAYIAGLKVIVFLDSRDFNYSPVRGFDDVMFISTSREIKEILELKEISVKKKSIDHFFWMEKGLPKWRLFLKS